MHRAVCLLKLTWSLVRFWPWAKFF